MSARTFNRERGDRSVRITAATTTVVKNAEGVLKAVTIGTESAGTITIRDALGIKAVFKAAMPARRYELDLLCAGKIEIVTAAVCDLVAAYD